MQGLRRSPMRLSDARLGRASPLTSGCFAVGLDQLLTACVTNVFQVKSVQRLKLLVSFHLVLCSLLGMNYIKERLCMKQVSHHEAACF